MQLAMVSIVSIMVVEATLRMPFGSRSQPTQKVTPPRRATGSPWVFPTNDWNIIPHLTHVQTLKPPTSGNIRLYFYQSTWPPSLPIKIPNWSVPSPCTCSHGPHWCAKSLRSPSPLKSPPPWIRRITKCLQRGGNGFNFVEERGRLETRSTHRPSSTDPKKNHWVSNPSKKDIYGTESQWETLLVHTYIYIVLYIIYMCACLCLSI